jgi:hypothetical protein
MSVRSLSGGRSAHEVQAVNVITLLGSGAVQRWEVLRQSAACRWTADHGGGTSEHGAQAVDVFLKV